MSADEIRALIEDALAAYLGEPITPELVEKMHQSAIDALPTRATVRYFRPFFKDMPNFWDDEHPAYVEAAGTYEASHADFLYGDDDDTINIRLCVRLIGMDDDS